MRQGIVIYDAAARGLALRAILSQVGFRQNGGKLFAAMVGQEQSQIDGSALVKALIAPIQHAGLAQSVL